MAGADALGNIGAGASSTLEIDWLPIVARMFLEAARNFCASWLNPQKKERRSSLPCLPYLRELTRCAQSQRSLQGWRLYFQRSNIKNV